MRAVHSERMVTAVNGSKSTVSKTVREPAVIAKDSVQQERSRSRAAHRERTRTQTLSPSESMLLSKLASVTSSDASNTPSQKEEEPKEKVVKPDGSDDDNYDDDFEVCAYRLHINNIKPIRIKLFLQILVVEKFY